MYEELVKQMRFCVEDRSVVECQDKCPNFGNFRPYEYCFSKLIAEAADAIEELEEMAMAYAETLHAYENPWTMITSRPMTAEEREEWEEKVGYLLTDDYAIVYTCPLPDDGQEILTCDMYGTIRHDTFEDDPDYGCGLEENGDLDGIVAWMPVPKPPKMDESEEEK